MHIAQLDGMAWRYQAQTSKRFSSCYNLTRHWRHKFLSFEISFNFFFLGLEFAASVASDEDLNDYSDDDEEDEDDEVQFNATSKLVILTDYLMQLYIL